MRQREYFPSISQTLLCAPVQSSFRALKQRPYTDLGRAGDWFSVVKLEMQKLATAACAAFLLFLIREMKPSQRSYSPRPRP